MEKKPVIAVNSAEFYVGLVILFLFVAAVMYFFPASIPFGLFEFFRFSFNWQALSGIPWMLMLFGPILTVIVSLFTKNDRSKNWEIRNSFDSDIWTSIKAGIFEETAYRWLVFYTMIITFTLRDIIFNWLLSFGWIATIFALPWWLIAFLLILINLVGFVAMAFASEYKDSGCVMYGVALAILGVAIILDIVLAVGIVKWWYTSVLLPLVNWITLGKMSHQLFGYSWMVGAAVVSSNWDFGQGHTYQGCVGWLNAWIIGMLMFWATFNFGLLFAMLIHVVYDIILHVIRYLDALAEIVIG